MSTMLATKTISCKVCCFSMVVDDDGEPLPNCARCGAQRWDVSAKNLDKGWLKPIPYIKHLLNTKIF